MSEAFVQGRFLFTLGIIVSGVVAALACCMCCTMVAMVYAKEHKVSGRTVLTYDVNRGSKELQVSSQTGFCAGMSVVTDDISENSEVGEIQSLGVDGQSLILRRP